MNLVAVIIFITNSMLIVSSYSHPSNQIFLLPYDTANQLGSSILNHDFSVMPLINTTPNQLPYELLINNKIYLMPTQSKENPYVIIKPTSDLSTLTSVINEIRAKDLSINLQPFQSYSFSDSKMNTLSTKDRMKVDLIQSKESSFFGLPVDGVMTNDNFDKEKTIDEIRAESMNPLIKINLLIRHSVGKLKKLEAAYAKQLFPNQVLTKFILRALLHPLKRFNTIFVIR
ncbi:uncharacterized protein LOC107360507 [Tetranychus urticae]|uniref:uncharacterized protein LOC107360507 n=1 Tax=Tetranychus urticae TaxID=32264 RepID=UPI00077BF9DF|nr:uncharacterized protein LOC107360507 [Tetranychus urticae]